MGLKDSSPIKAAQLSGANNILFRRNSLSGSVEAVAWQSSTVTLNDDLHAN